MTGQMKVRYVTKAAETEVEYVRTFNVKVGTTDEQLRQLGQVIVNLGVETDIVSISATEVNAYDAGLTE
ncbi:hypothetical protein ACAW68_01975 [Weissella confusa]|uniref:hypothetical protein n=1 Tax=Weissella confusa TaxID=1583 RepID=UPI0035A27138